MFNKLNYKGGSVNNSQSVEINAVTGAILKNHPKSWFERFHLKSKFAEERLTEGGHKAYKSDYKAEYNRVPEKDITILQMVICGDMEVIAECVYTKDYDNKTDTERLQEQLLQKENEIENLQAHINFLNQERLTPCNVGDLVFLPWQFDGVTGVAFLRVTKIVLGETTAYIETDLTTDSEEFFEKYNCGKFDFSDIGNTVFLTQEDAKRALNDK